MSDRGLGTKHNYFGGGMVIETVKNHCLKVSSLSGKVLCA